MSLLGSATKKSLATHVCKMSSLVLMPEPPISAPPMSYVLGIGQSSLWGFTRYIIGIEATNPKP